MPTNTTNIDSSNPSLLYNLEIWQSASMVVFCFLIWNVPHLFTAEFIYSMSIFILFELILIHSGGFMSVGYPIGMILFLPAYGFLAYVFNKISPDNFILIFFFLTMLIRCKGIFVEDKAAFAARMSRKSFGSLALVFVAIFLSRIMFTFLSRGGLTEKFLDSIDYYAVDKTTGNVEIYHIIMFGMIYYLAQIWFEWWLSRPGEKDIVSIINEYFDS